MIFHCWSCNANQAFAIQKCSDTMTGYEIVMRVFENGNSLDRVMDAFTRNGLMITGVLQIYLSAEKLEIRTRIRGGSIKQLSETESQLRSVLKVESILINRL